MKTQLLGKRTKWFFVFVFPAYCEDNMNVTDSEGNDCTEYIKTPINCGDQYDTEEFVALRDCCVCRGM